MALADAGLFMQSLSCLEIHVMSSCEAQAAQQACDGQLGAFSRCARWSGLPEVPEQRNDQVLDDGHALCSQRLHTCLPSAPNVEETLAAVHSQQLLSLLRPAPISTQLKMTTAALHPQHLIGPMSSA